MIPRFANEATSYEGQDGERAHVRLAARQSSEVSLDPIALLAKRRKLSPRPHAESTTSLPMVLRLRSSSASLSRQSPEYGGRRLVEQSGRLLLQR